MFGRVEDIDTLAHAIGAAGGWVSLKLFNQKTMKNNTHNRVNDENFDN